MEEERTAEMITRPIEERPVLPDDNKVGEAPAQALKSYKVRISGHPVLRGEAVFAVTVALKDADKNGRMYLETDGVVAGLISAEAVRMVLYQIAAGAGEHFMPGFNMFVEDLMAAEAEKNAPAPVLTDVEREYAERLERENPELFDSEHPAVLRPEQPPEATPGFPTQEGEIGYTEHPANVPMDRPDTKEDEQ